MSALGKSVLGRADLLRVLALQDEIALEKMAAILGYQVKKTRVMSPEPLIIRVRGGTPELGSKPIAKPDKKLVPSFFYIAERERKPPEDQPLKPEVPEDLQWGDILSEDACVESANLSLPPHSPLIRWPRLWPFLRTVLGTHYPSRKPDIPQLIRQIANAEAMRQIPMQTQHGWSVQCCLLLDFNLQTQAYYLDFTELQTRLTKMHGETGLDVRILEGEAGLQTQFRKSRKNDILTWQMPAIDTPLLILSDLGLLAESPQLKQGWQRFGRLLRAAGCKPHVLCPVPASYLDKTLQGLFTIDSWDKNSHLHGQSIHLMADDLGANDPLKQQQGVQTLLILLSVAVIIEPGLLRAIRNLLAVDQVNVADEARFWQHPDISSSTQGCCFKTQAAVKQYQQQLVTDDFWRTLKLEASAEQQHFKKCLVKLMQVHHAYLPQSVRMMEMDQCERVLPATVDQQTQAEIQHWQQAMARTCYQLADQQNLQAWNQDYIASLPVIMLQNPSIAVLWACAQKQKLDRGEIIQYPETINKQHVEFILAREVGDESLLCRVFQVGDELRISEKNTNIEASGSYYADLMLQGDLSIKTEHPHGSVNKARWQWQNTRDTVSQGNSKVIVELEQTMQQVSLSNARETLILKSLTKPDWISQMGRDLTGLWVEFEQQGQQWRVYWPAWGGELGYDQYGLYNDLTIKGVIQRSRFIPPGTFQMGSPASEQERSDDENIHQVTLTQGYWLADTACTQALWQAVMGENPANFKKDKDNPVEKVSWDNVQVFLKKINRLIPGLAASLPTEAQWEYACRAGTKTVFSFGNNITPEQVNYDGNYPYASEKKGLDRSTTVPVKSLPANPWGLYEMHGNVWEWCQDEYGKYLNTAVSDPAGVENSIPRMLRGGSWFDFGRRTRSAYRRRRRPDFRSIHFGFRFAPGQVQFREAEPEVAAMERGKQPEKEDQGFLKKLWDKVKSKK